MEQNILALSAKLPDITEHVLNMGINSRDKEWTAMYSQTLLVADFIDDYQVIRYFDSESEFFDDPFDDRNIPERAAIIDKYIDRLFQIDNEYEEDSQDYYNAKCDVEMDLCEEMYDTFGYESTYHFCIREYAQVWINVHTCDVTIIGRPWTENRNYVYDPEKPMEIIDPKGRLSYWCKNILTFMPSHFDLSRTHPLLTKNGYREIQVWEYDYTYDKAPTMYDILDDTETTITDFLIGYINRKKATRLHTLIDSLPESIFQEIQEEDISTFFTHIVPALKIARRHGYTAIDDKWIKLIQLMASIDLDTRNPKYICPQDIDSTMLFVKKQKDIVLRRRERERQRRIAEERLIAIKRNIEVANAFAQRMAIYSSCRISNSELDIFPASTGDDLIEEGKAMHHCVGGYIGKQTAIILFVRDKFGARIATCEVSTETWHIVQTRGICNSVPQYNGQLYENEINELILNFLIPQLKAAHDAATSQESTTTTKTA